MYAGFQNLPRIPELRRRLGFTLMILAVYRLAVAVPTPGIDGEALGEYFHAASASVFDMVNLFSGGAFASFAVLSRSFFDLELSSQISTASFSICLAGLSQA